MWPLLNLHLPLSSSLSRSLLPCFQILNILSLLLPSFTSALKIETLNNGTNSSAGEKDVRSYLPGNATETDIVTAGELTRTIMGLLPTLLQNQTAAEKAELNKRVNEKVETFFSQLRLGGGEGGVVRFFLFRGGMVARRHNGPQSRLLAPVDVCTMAIVCVCEGNV